MRSSVLAGLVPLASAGVLTRHHTTTTTEIVEIVPSATFHPLATSIHTIPAQISPLSTAIVEPTYIPESSVTQEATMTQGPTIVTATAIIPETTVVPQPTIKPATTIATTVVSTESSSPIYVSPSWGSKEVVKDTHGDTFYMVMAIADDVDRHVSHDVLNFIEATFTGGYTPESGLPLTLSNPSKDIYAPTFLGTGEPSSWNLRHGDLLTAGEPSNDEMYFRIAHAKGEGFQVPVVTTNKHKNHLSLYHNAKLQGNHDWQFKLDTTNRHYHLQNNEDKGSFYYCATPSPVFEKTPDALYFASDMQNLPSKMCFPVVLAAYQFA